MPKICPFLSHCPSEKTYYFWPIILYYLLTSLFLNSIHSVDDFQNQILSISSLLKFLQSFTMFRDWKPIQDSTIWFTYLTIYHPFHLFTPTEPYVPNSSQKKLWTFKLLYTWNALSPPTKNSIQVSLNIQIKIYLFMKPFQTALSGFSIHAGCFLKLHF